MSRDRLYCFFSRVRLPTMHQGRHVDHPATILSSRMQSSLRKIDTIEEIIGVFVGDCPHAGRFKEIDQTGADRGLIVNDADCWNIPLQVLIRHRYVVSNCQGKYELPRQIRNAASA